MTGERVRACAPGAAINSSLLKCPHSGCEEGQEGLRLFCCWTGCIGDFCVAFLRGDVRGIGTGEPPAISDKGREETCDLKVSDSNEENGWILGWTRDLETESPARDSQRAKRLAISELSEEDLVSFEESFVDSSNGGGKGLTRTVFALTQNVCWVWGEEEAEGCCPDATGWTLLLPKRNWLRFRVRSSSF